MILQNIQEAQTERSKWTGGIHLPSTFGNEKEHMLVKLTSWEALLKEWETMWKEHLSDWAKCSVLAERAPKEVRTHFFLNAGSLQDHDKMRKGQGKGKDEKTHFNRGEKRDTGGTRKEKDKGAGDQPPPFGKGQKGDGDVEIEGYCGKCWKWGQSQVQMIDDKTDGAASSSNGSNPAPPNPVPSIIETTISPADDDDEYFTLEF
eukprot:1082279-Amphidinium_carterae.1